MFLILFFFRCPRYDATDDERTIICNRCVEIIHRHLSLMNSLCKGVVTESKLKSATIGLLYMIRQGIVVHELVVLPKIQVMRNVPLFTRKFHQADQM